MQIPLNDFEQFIDDTILKRGLSYFKSGAITDFSEMSNGQYEAIVSGTEAYTVQLKISNRTIVEHNCDCPYDMGPVCKHIVAVIFHLQQDELKLNQPVIPKPRKKKTKSVSQQVKELLKTISHKELIEFVEENTKKDREFRVYFLASFGHISGIQSKEFYQKQIHSSLQTAKGRDGWISWHEMKFLNKTMQPVLENLAKNFSNKELIEFVEENTKKDREFRVYFLASFGHISGIQSKEFYQKQIHSSLQTAKGRDGWISWHEMKFLNKTMQPVLENLAKNFENKNFEVVFLMSTALLEEMTKAFDFADDSSGDIGYFINVATESLTKLAEEKLPAPLKQKVFEYCISSYKQKIFEGWDWHLGLLYKIGRASCREGG